jgi:hypothetical protein
MNFHTVLEIDTVAPGTGTLCKVSVVDDPLPTCTESVNESAAVGGVVPCFDVSPGLGPDPELPAFPPGGVLPLLGESPAGLLVSLHAANAIESGIDSPSASRASATYLIAILR